nr:MULTISPECIES: hypothetical protein [Mycobacterium]
MFASRGGTVRIYARRAEQRAHAVCGRQSAEAAAGQRFR